MNLACIHSFINILPKVLQRAILLWRRLDLKLNKTTKRKLETSAVLVKIPAVPWDSVSTDNSRDNPIINLWVNYQTSLFYWVSLFQNLK